VPCTQGTISASGNTSSPARKLAVPKTERPPGPRPRHPTCADTDSHAAVRADRASGATSNSAWSARTTPPRGIERPRDMWSGDWMGCARPAARTARRVRRRKVSRREAERGWLSPMGCRAAARCCRVSTRAACCAPVSVGNRRPLRATRYDVPRTCASVRPRYTRPPGRGGSTKRAVSRCAVVTSWWPPMLCFAKPPSLNSITSAAGNPFPFDSPLGPSYPTFTFQDTAKGGGPTVT